MKITVVVVNRDRLSLEPRLEEIAGTTSELVPNVQPHISILSHEQWALQHAAEAAAVRYNAWLAPEITL